MKLGMLATAVAAWTILLGSVEIQADEPSLPVHSQKNTIRMAEYEFQPASVTFTIGIPVELTLVNEGTILHEFVTKALLDLETDVVINGAVAETRGIEEMELPPGTRATLRFTPKKAGEFSYTCESRKPKSHLASGMTGLMVFE